MKQPVLAQRGKKQPQHTAAFNATKLIPSLLLKDSYNKYEIFFKCVNVCVAK